MFCHCLTDFFLVLCYGTTMPSLTYFPAPLPTLGLLGGPTCLRNQSFWRILLPYVPVIARHLRDRSLLHPNITLVVIAAVL